MDDDIEPLPMNHVSSGKFDLLGALGVGPIAPAPRNDGAVDQAPNTGNTPASGQYRSRYQANGHVGASSGANLARLTLGSGQTTAPGADMGTQSVTTSKVLENSSASTIVSLDRLLLIGVTADPAPAPTPLPAPQSNVPTEVASLTPGVAAASVTGSTPTAPLPVTVPPVAQTSVPAPAPIYHQSPGTVAVQPLAPCSDVPPWRHVKLKLPTSCVHQLARGVELIPVARAP